MKRRVTALRTVAVGMLAVALGGAAYAGNPASVASASATQESGASAAQNATLHVDLPSMAANVIDLVVSGASPSAVSNRGGQSANAKPKTEVADDDVVDEANEQAVNLISPSQMARESGTVGTRPGWGCGDKNHEHTGPPGRPGASPPPGCAKSR